MSVVFEILKYLNSFEAIIFVATALFCFSHSFRKYAKIPYIAVAAFCLSTPFWFFRVVPISVFEVGWFNAYYLIYFIFVIAIHFACFKASFKETIFYSTAGYTLQHFIYAVLVFFFDFIFNVSNISLRLSCSALFTVIAVIVYYRIFVMRVKKSGKVNLNNLSLILFSFFTIIVINVWNLYSRNISSSNAGSIGYAIICTVLLFCVQFGFFERNKLERDKEIFEKVVLSAEKQALNLTENIDIINRKCHDLKHFVSAMELMSEEEKNKNFKELHKAIDMYDATVKTGNVILDAVLIEKMLICEKYEIEFTYFVDAVRMDFMETADVYTLFGNALDNAIESVRQIEKKDSRIINANITQRDNLLSISIRNYCKDSVVFDGGLPVTNKADKNNHGFGVRSIKFIVDKYHGTLEMNEENRIFEVNILFFLN